MGKSCQINLVSDGQNGGLGWLSDCLRCVKVWVKVRLKIVAGYFQMGYD